MIGRSHRCPSSNDGARHVHVPPLCTRHHTLIQTKQFLVGFIKRMHNCVTYVSRLWAFTCHSSWAGGWVQGCTQLGAMAKQAWQGRLQAQRSVGWYDICVLHGTLRLAAAAMPHPSCPPGKFHILKAGLAFRPAHGYDPPPKIGASPRAPALHCTRSPYCSCCRRCLWAGPHLFSPAQ